MSFHHLSLSPSQQSFIMRDFTRLQTLQYTTEKRICTLILLSDPSRHPANQHGINKHLHQTETPTTITIKFQIQITDAKESIFIFITSMNRWRDKLRGTPIHPMRRLDIMLGSSSDRFVPSLRCHVSPIRNNTHTSIAFMCSMLHIGTICTI